jgi:hypothetical protein
MALGDEFGGDRVADATVPSGDENGASGHPSSLPTGARVP